VTPRSRTVEWEDPLPSLERARGMSGLEFLRAIRDGELPPPPIAKLMGMTISELDEGRAVFAAQPAEFHYNPIGAVHGGLAATLLDSALGCAVQTTLEPGVAYTTLELKVNFVRPITVDTGPVLSEATVLHRGSKIATAEGRVMSERDGRLLAHATTTCLLFPAT
jgi:uncharacterized protein (TIGR00369 family)